MLVEFFFLLQVLENVLLADKTYGEAKQKTISEVHEKLSLLEDGMKNLFAEGNPSADKNNSGLLDIVFATLFGPYKAEEEVLDMEFIVPEKFPVLFSWLMALIDIKVVGSPQFPENSKISTTSYCKFLDIMGCSTNVYFF